MESNNRIRFLLIFRFFNISIIVLIIFDCLQLKCWNLLFVYILFYNLYVAVIGIIGNNILNNLFADEIIRFSKSCQNSIPCVVDRIIVEAVVNMFPLIILFKYEMCFGVVACLPYRIFLLLFVAISMNVRSCIISLYKEIIPISSPEKWASVHVHILEHNDCLSKKKKTFFSHVFLGGFITQQMVWGFLVCNLVSITWFYYHL